MSPGLGTQGGGACPACRRRRWLLAELGGVLDYHAHERTRLLELLALEDGELLGALAGRRAPALRERYERFAEAEAEAEAEAGAGADAGTIEICRHDPRFPSVLAAPEAPRMLELSASAERLAEMLAAPAVAIAGSRTPSDYGRQTASSLARGLSASGVTVVACLAEGIAMEAHLGAHGLGRGSVAVAPDGLGVEPPAHVRGLRGRIARAGCVVAELPFACEGRRWGAAAGERTVVELAAAVVVVEARDTPADLGVAEFARARGVALAAVPGRVTSSLAQGTNGLLVQGAASLVRGAEDVLELLWAAGARGGTPGGERRAGAGPAGAWPGVREDLRAVLERVGEGCDTPDKLAGGGADHWELLGQLGELELLGLLGRGGGGRYVPRAPRSSL
ncbi:MAG TPA: DNA-processing protein DprA [Solirubrobacteraceae bacterium]|nr:DNA-processing protein DprA [Solirubrobacteraceae bacterium]